MEDLTAPPSSVRAALHMLVLDRAAVEAVRHLDQIGIRAILLKGPSFAHWLYQQSEPRNYSDIDLLIDPDRWADALTALEELGYRQVFGSRYDPPHASVLRRDADGALLDLHRSIQAIDAPALHVWSGLSRRTTRMTLAGHQVEILDEVGRCFNLAVHAGRPDATGRRALSELYRALSETDPHVWHEAEALAADLGGQRAFRAGISQRAVASTASALGLLVGETASDAPIGAAVWARSRTQGGGVPYRALIPWLLPTPTAIRQVRPVARRGPFGLIAAYATWPLWLLIQAVALARWRARRKEGEEPR